MFLPANFRHLICVLHHILLFCRGKCGDTQKKSRSTLANLAKVTLLQDVFSCHGTFGRV